MGLEAGDGYISGLVATNPVGATDPKSQGDDHIRLIKTALLGTFPNLNGAVTAAPAELNILDGATLSTAELNILDGVTLTAAQINDAARLSASNTFTSAVQTISAAAPALALNDTSQAADNKLWRWRVASGNYALTAYDDAVSSGNNAIVVGRSGTTITSVALTATSITLNSVASSDFARLSQANTFTANQTLAKATARLILNDTGAATYSFLDFSENGTFRGGIGQNFGSNQLGGGSADLDIVIRNENGGLVFTGDGGSTSQFSISSSGAVKAAAIANSTSTTLVAGQIHFIDGDATLPNLTAGQWIQIVNDGSSSRTISKNGSDTTYWTATGASVSSGFTLAARGVLTARCNPAGSSVYVSGSGITSAS